MENRSPIIDISLPLHPKMPIWPGSEEINIHRINHLEADDKVSISRPECDVSIGTHVDAPLHFIELGNAVEALFLDPLTGPAVVVAIPDAKVVTAKHLTSIGLPSKKERLLLRTLSSD